jgi:hypothetical protein
MNDAVAVALLSLIGTAIGSFGGILSTQRLVKYRLEQLEGKVDKYNNVSERVAELEIKNKVCEHRLEKLELM